MRNLGATIHSLLNGVRRGWRNQRGSQGLQAAAVAVVAAAVIAALLASFDGRVQPAVQRAIDCANAELSGLTGCASGEAAIQQAFDQANAALGQPGTGGAGSGGGSTGTAAGAAAGAGAGGTGDTAAHAGAAAAGSWWDSVGQWFSQQWQDTKEAGAMLWAWLHQAAVVVGMVVGVIAGAIAAIVAAILGAPILIVGGIVALIVGIIAGTVYANDQHGQPWYTNLLKHLGIGVAAVVVGVLTWALELSVAAIAGATAAVALVAAGVTALLNKLNGERRWDKGLLLNIGLALATLGAGVVLRGARAADTPPVVQGVDDVADAAPDARPALPCGGALPTGRGPGLAAPAMIDCVPFNNTLPERLAGELQLADDLGVRPIRVDDPTFEAVVNADTIKWVVTIDGELLIIPKFVGGEEIAHTALTRGQPVLAAGEASIAGANGQVLGLEINNHSGHYLPSLGSLSIGRKGFEQYGIVFP